ncbi:hypothetical protein ACGFWI_00965 [Streptomyces sp. NPDC048434]|uniref:hypothetical protein n=1 Tax=Streptomyces sp. NPDC048434 TaxID=3365549 RepID=UPI0037129958
MRCDDISFDLAADHSAESQDQSSFLLAYSSGRSRVRQGCDVEADWLLLKASARTSPAMLAGFIEGLASTRELPKGGGR